MVETVMRRASMDSNPASKELNQSLGWWRQTAKATVKAVVALRSFCTAVAVSTGLVRGERPTAQEDLPRGSGNQGWVLASPGLADRRAAWKLA
ncbi:hypothetical protein ACFRFL_34470 [Streptomyces sp. NPDC056708]|uniref:hypothetical protein n=1 Tax=unclassified Streptomyces TaxID=2593676 RepID=UPI0036C874B6